MKKVLYSPLFWVFFTLFSGASAFVAYYYFPQAFSIINVPITMERTEALEQAKLIALKQNLLPAQADSTAFFQTDYLVQFFVELDAGGKEAFEKMIKDDLYQPYTWRVRLYKEHEAAESVVIFTSDGKPYGFHQTISENTPGAQLDAQEARTIAELGAQQWDIDLSRYKLIESAKEVVPSGRIDHAFTYERPDIKIGDGFYRLRLHVSGDSFSELTHFVQVPENFTRKYTEMRSANDTIAYYAKIALMLLYFFGGCILGLLFLLRRRYIIWKPACAWALLFTVFAIGSGLNNMPLAWVHYDTALSATGYIIQYILSILISSAQFAFFFTIIFAAAESLTRYAFGNHIQFWSTWKPGIANSLPVIGRTIGAYLMVPIFLAFAILLYLFMNRTFGWWSPASSLFDPNILATYLPWYGPLTTSLQAGFWEECMFRAVPLSCAAILGNRFGKRNWWIGGALIAQALIFGAGHANYPAQPAIARVVELFIPSLMFGGMYLAFGLMAGIITHFLYDTLLFSIPLLVATGPYAHLYRGIVLIGALIPILVILLRRIQQGRWNSFPAQALNRAWEPPLEEKVERVQAPQHLVSPFSRVFYGILFGLGLLSIGAWYWTTPHQQEAQPLMIEGELAVALAQEAFAQLGIDTTKPWNAYPKAYTNFETNNELRHQNRFIWQAGGKDAYQKLLGTHLQNPYWQVRFIQFDGPLIDRAEEVLIVIDNKNQVARVVHTVPESRPGAQLDEQETRNIAHEALKNKYNLNPEELTEISATPNKRPERLDWIFIFADKKSYPLSKGQALRHSSRLRQGYDGQAGQARIKIAIAGDQISDYNRFIQVPEEWSRAEKNKENAWGIFHIISYVLIYLIFFIGSFVVAIRRSSKLPSIQSVALIFIGILLIECASIFNTYSTTIAALFNTSQPFQDQWIRIFVSMLFKAFFITALYTVLIAYISQYRIPTRLNRTGLHALLGIVFGIFLAGIQATAHRLVPSLEPLWADYENLFGWSPALQGIASAVLLMISLSIFFILLFAIADALTKHGTDRKIAALSLLMIIGFAFSGILYADNFLLFATFGASMGALSIFAYYMVFRYDFALIPLAVAGYLSTSLLGQVFFNAYPHAILIFIASAICVILIALVWFKKLNISQPKEVV